jgi:tetratricopeptide (TPR) repeat protein
MAVSTDWSAEALRLQYMQRYRRYAQDAATPSPDNFRRIEAEMPNIRLAMEYAHRDGQCQVALDVACAVRNYCLLQGEWQSVRDWAHRALEAAHVLCDPRAVALWTHALARCQHAMGNLIGAESNYEQAMAVAHAQNDAKVEAEAFHWLGWLKQAQREPHVAQRYCRAAMRLRRSLGDRVGEASSWRQLASLVEEEGHLERARRFIQVSNELVAGQQGWEALQLRSALHYDLARLDVAAGDLDSARRHLQEALPQAAAVPDRLLVADIRFYIDAVAGAARDQQTVRERVQGRLELGETAEEGPGLAPALFALGRQYLAHSEDMSELEKARTFFEKAADISTGHNWAVAQAEIGLLHYRTGDMVSARQRMQAALKSFQAGGSVRSVAGCWQWLALIAAADEDPTDAEDHLQQSLQLSLEAGLRTEAAQACYHLGCLAEKSGDRDMACEWLKRAWEQSHGADPQTSAMIRNALERLGEAVAPRGHLAGPPRIFVSRLIMRLRGALPLGNRVHRSTRPGRGR